MAEEVEIDNYKYYNDKEKNILPYSEDELASFIFVGCWGTYCTQNNCGDTTNRIRNNCNINLLTINKDTNQIEREQPRKQVGSYNVAMLMKRLSDIYSIKSIILGGDNIYKSNKLNIDIIKELFPSEEFSELEIIYNSQYNTTRDDLIDLYNQKITANIETIKSQFRDNKQQKTEIKNYMNYIKSNLYDMDGQFLTGFLECLKEVKTPEFLIGLGNHDVENCEVLDKQLSYKQINNKWNMPGLSFNKIYTNGLISINFIIIDTNMYENENLCITKNRIHKYDPNAIQNQLDWIRYILNTTNNTYYFIVGHIPFFCLGHKEIIRSNHQLKTDMDKLYETKKNFIYMCADSHSQQIIKGGENSPLCIVAGSGGASLDILTIDKLANKSTPIPIATSKIYLKREHNLDVFYHKTAFGCALITTVSSASGGVNIIISMYTIDKEDANKVITINTDDNTITTSDD